MVKTQKKRKRVDPKLPKAKAKHTTKTKTTASILQRLRNELLKADSLEFLRDLSLSLADDRVRRENALAWLERGFHVLPLHCIPLRDRIGAAGSQLFDLLWEWKTGKCVMNCKEMGCDCECHDCDDEEYHEWCEDPPKDYDDPCEYCISKDPWELDWQPVHDFVIKQLEKEVLRLFGTRKKQDGAEFARCMMSRLHQFDSEPYIKGDVTLRTGSEDLEENKDFTCQEVSKLLVQAVETEQLPSSVRDLLVGMAEKWVHDGNPFEDLVDVIECSD